MGESHGFGCFSGLKKFTKLYRAASSMLAFVSFFDLGLRTLIADASSVFFRCDA